MSDPIHVRVFLSSPSDVGSERSAARRILGELPRDPLLRGRVTVEVVSWDDPHAPTPMPANLPPQHTIDRTLPKPSECDLTTVILWRRMGTPTRSMSSAELHISGTASEAEDALRAKKTVLIYHRHDSGAPATDATDDERRQLALLRNFLARFRNADGTFKGFVNEYASLEGFEKLFEAHMKAELRAVIERDRKRARRRALVALALGFLLCALLAFLVDVSAGALAAFGLSIASGTVSLVAARSRLRLGMVGLCAVLLFLMSAGWCSLTWSYATRSQRELIALVDLASTRSEQGRSADAVQAYAQCEGLARKLARVRTRTECLCGKAGQEWLLDQEDAAATDFRECLTSALDLRDAAAEGRARLGLGRLAALGDKPAVALPLYEDSAAAYARAKQPIGVGDVRRAMAELHQKQGDLNAARAALVEARASYESAHSLPGTAQVDLALGDIELEAGNPDSAKGHYEAALQAAIRSNDRLGQANALLQLGELTRQTNNSDAAPGYYTQAEALFTHEHNGLGVGNVYRGLADLDAALGHLDVARGEYERAISFFRAANSPEGEANAQLGTGTIERDARNLKLASQSFQAAFELFNKAGDRAGASNALLEQGELAVASEDEKSAKRLFEEALRLAHDSGNGFGEGNALLALGRLFVDTNAPLARRYLTDASSAFEQAHNEPGRGNVAFLLGKLSSNADDEKEAERQFTFAYDVFNRIGDLRGQGNVLLERAVLAANRGRRKESEKAFQEARAAYQRADEPAAELNVDLTEAEALTKEGKPREAAAVLSRAATAFEAQKFPDFAAAAKNKAQELKLTWKDVAR